MFDPPKVRKVKILKLLWGFFRRQFASFCLFWHLNWPRPAAQWVRPNFFGPEGGQTIPPHHSIAKYLKNLKLIPRTTTFFLRHCVKSDGIYKVMPSSTIFPTLNLSKISEDSLLSIYVSATCMYLYFYWHTNYHFKCVQTCTNKCKIHCQKCI